MELSICLDCPFTLWLNIIFLVVIMYGHLIVEYLIQIFELSIQAIQVGATKVLSLLLTISDYSQPYFSGNACFGFDDNQVWHLCFVLILLHFPFSSSECSDCFFFFHLSKCLVSDCRFKAFCWEQSTIRRTWRSICCFSKSTHFCCTLSGMLQYFHLQSFEDLFR